MSPCVMAQLFITGFLFCLVCFGLLFCVFFLLGFFFGRIHLPVMGERKILCLDKLSCTPKCSQPQEYCRMMATVRVTVLFSLYILQFCASTSKEIA